MLDSILSSAAEDAAGTSLPWRTVLLRQTVSHLSLSRAALWEVRAGQVIGLDSVVQSQASPLPEPHLDAGACLESVIQLSDDQRHSTEAARSVACVNLSADRFLLLDVAKATGQVSDSLLLELATVFADVQRRKLVDDIAHERGQQKLADALVIQLHTTLEAEVVANVMATDGAVALGCERVSVARQSTSGWHVIATTGVHQPNDRADAVRIIRDRMQAASVQTQTRTESGHAITVPFTDVGWCLDLEFGHDDVPNAQALDQVCQHALLGFQNCEQHQQSRLSRWFRSRWYRRPKALFVAGLLVAGFLLAIIPGDFTVNVYGELQPVSRAYVFAPDSGTVIDVRIEDGSDVGRGDRLCAIRNDDLDVRLESVEGELATANSRISAIDALRGRGAASGQNDGMLSAERLELEKKIESLEKQALILRKRHGELLVNSRISGRVYGDRLRQLLDGRPVRRGQFLFEVADSVGTWTLELQIPELDVRHVMLALDESESPLRVDYTLQTSPEQVRLAELRSLGSSVNLDRSGQPNTLGFAESTDQDFSSQRPGTGVVAAIHCGRRSLGYIWFRKPIEFFRRKTGL